MCFLREPWPWAPSRRRVARRASSLSAGATSWPRRARLDRDGEHAADRAARAGALSCTGRGAPRAYRRLPGGPPGRRLRGVALVPHGHVQRALRRDAASSFYPDLADPGWATCGRSSTSGSRRTPRRAGSARAAVPALGHNGEINTIDGNVEWMEARERARGPDPDLAPALDRTGVDSALDNALEPQGQKRPRRPRAPSACSSCRPGRTTPAYPTSSARCTGTTRCSPSPGTARQAWSSPTASSAAPPSTATACARSASPSATTGSWQSRRRRVQSPCPTAPSSVGGGSGSGQPLSVDPERGLLFDGELKRDLASRKPYGAWVEGSVRFGDQMRPAAGASGSTSPAPRSARLHARGAEPHAAADRANGRRPVYSMGDDAPIALLAKSRPPARVVLRQRFAQDEP